VEIRKLVHFLLYTDQNRRAHKARQHDGKNWTHTENLRVLETALGEHLQSLTVSKTAFDKLMPLKGDSHSMPCPCRAHAAPVLFPLPCRAAKGLERIFPI